MPQQCGTLTCPHLPALRSRLPGIDIELSAEPVQVDLSRREADIAIRFRRPQAADLVVRVIATVQYFLCGAPAYIAAHSPETWEFIGDDDSLAETPQQEWLESFAGMRAFALRCNDLNAIYSATQAGLGVAVLPDFLARGLIIDGSECPVRRKLWMVIHDDIRKSQRVRRTADQLAELFSAPAR